MYVSNCNEVKSSISSYKYASENVYAVYGDTKKQFLKCTKGFMIFFNACRRFYLKKKPFAHMR